MTATGLSQAIACVSIDGLHEGERKLIALMRLVGYGEVHVKIQDGVPMVVEEVVYRLKLV